MRELAAVACGGMLGAVGRYLLTGWVHRWAGTGFPWGTLAVNAVGCLALGSLMVVVQETSGLGSGARLFLGVGLLGSLTTYSTFGYETIALLRAGESELAAANVGGNVLLAIGAVLLGQAAMRWILN